MTPRIALVFLYVAIAACTQRYEWTREGAGDGEIELARQQCSGESTSYDFLDGRDQSRLVVTSRGDRYSYLNANTASRQANLFSDCMRAKGFNLAPVTKE